MTEKFKSLKKIPKFFHIPIDDSAYFGYVLFAL